MMLRSIHHWRSRGQLRLCMYVSLLCISLLISACAPEARTITLIRKDTRAVTGDIVAVHDGWILVAPSGDIPSDLRVMPRSSSKQKRRSKALERLTHSSVVLHENEIQSATLASEDHVGTGLLVGLILATAFALIGHSAGDEEPDQFLEPSKDGLASLYFVLFGIPAILIGLLAGSASSFSEESIPTTEANWSDRLIEHSYFLGNVPPELDSLAFMRR